jgi:predicted transposase YbfD/YdcC
LSKQKTEVLDLDVKGILADFSDLPDPRSHVNRRHILGEIIVMSIMAVIAGAEGPKAIGLWAKNHESWLMKLLSLPGGIPSHDTFGRVLMALKPAAFQACFERWLRRVSAKHDNGEREIIAIDGKTLRGSHDRAAGLGPLCLVSAWSVRRGISLGQLATDEKSNEITAIPELLDTIDVNKAIVTIDAAGCQKSIASQIYLSGGDYVLALKANQGGLHAAVVEYVNAQIEDDFKSAKARSYTERVNGHGRKDELAYYQMPMPHHLAGRAGWHGMQTIGVVVRMSERGDTFTSDVRYYISSLRMGVKLFAACARGHWGIENTLHWCLDVTFREDDCRVRNRILAENVAWLKRFAISLLKQVNDKESIAMRRRIAGWNPDYILKVLEIPA